MEILVKLSLLENDVVKATFPHSAWILWAVLMQVELNEAHEHSSFYSISFKTNAKITENQ